MFGNKASETFPLGESKEQIKKIKFEVGELGIPKEGHPISEDSILVDEENMVFAILDGIGGHSAGEIASKTAKLSLQNNADKLETSNGKKILNPAEIAEQLSAKLISADSEIYEEARKDPSKRKMGTTASVVKLFENPEGKKFAIVASAGDSRVYLLSDGKLKKLTRDDHALKDLGIPKEDFLHFEEKMDSAESINDLNGIDIVAFRTRNSISNYLGRDRGAVIKTLTIELSPGDKIIITSDGVHDNLTTKEIEKIVYEDLPAKSISNKLIRAARDRSEKLDPETGERHLRAKKDDMSTIVIEIEPRKRPPPIEDEITQKIIRK